MSKHKMELMFLDELEAEIQKAPIVYVPCGSIEWHGPHLAVGCDALRAGAICERAAELTGGVVFPPLTLAAAGYSAYRGSAFFSAELVSHYTRELMRELEKMGFRLAVFVLGHAGLAQEEGFGGGIAAHGADRPLRGIVLFSGEMTVPPEEMGHAGTWETAEALAAAPEAVDLDRFDAGATVLPKYDADPEAYAPGLSPLARERLLVHMNATEWSWDPELARKVTPEIAEAWLQEHGASLAVEVRKAYPLPPP